MEIVKVRRLHGPTLETMNFVSNNQLSYYDRVTGKKYAVGTTHVAKVNDTIRQYFLSNYMTLGTKDDLYYGFAYSESAGVAETVRYSANGKSKTKSSYKEWIAARKRGDIIMGPYRNATIDVVAQPGIMKRGSSGTNGKTLYLYTTHFAQVSGLCERASINGASYWFLKGTNIALTSGQLRGLVWYTFEDTLVTPPLLDLQGMVDTFLSTPIHQPDGVLVTEAIASANTGTIDFLTAAAEMPETLKSIFNGIKTIGRLTRAAQRREITVNKRYKDRATRINENFNRKIKRVRNSDTKQKLKEQQLARLSRERSKSLKANGSEFTTAAASVWMNYRYNIMPNVYLIDDLLDTLANWYTDYVTTRQKTSGSLGIDFPTRTLEDFGFELVTPPEAAIHRCVIKRKYVLGNDISTKLLQVGSANMAVTALELLKRSFVLGWFINLGDYLSAMTAPSVHQMEKCSYALKQDTIATYTHPSGSSVVVKTNCYKRDIINPDEHVTLGFEKQFMNLYRYFDSAAMLWPTIRKILTKPVKGRI